MNDFKQTRRKIRVVIAEDQTMVLGALAALLEMEGDIAVVAQARNGKEALERLEVGEFGICEVCGEDISEARLKARPVTTYCIDCKMEQERKEKLP